MYASMPKSALAGLLFALVVPDVFVQAQESKPQTAESTVSESPYKIRTERNVVVLRVIVRDKTGKAVTGLHKEDFRLFDNGKPQVITNFSVENASVAAAPAAAESRTQPPPGGEGSPQRFVAFLFDDVNTTFGQVAEVRAAGEHFLDTSLSAGDRVALFTTSGQGEVGFTADRAKLKAALLKLQSRTLAMPSHCPSLTDYEAYTIAGSLSGGGYIAIAAADVSQCLSCKTSVSANGSSQTVQTCHPEVIAKAAAQARWDQVELQLRYSVRALGRVVERLSVMPGQRTLSFISPGFISLTQRPEISEVTDRAVRAGVVINSLDARGLRAVVPAGSASENVPYIPLALWKEWVNLQIAGQKVQSGVLGELAYSTGGVYFHDSNDFDAGFRETGGLPEASYVLTFSPDNIKYDGSFHTLKVALVNPSDLTLQARRGYFAPKKSEDLAQRARDDLEEAAFSRDVLHDLPMEVNTRIVKSDELNAKLTVVAHVDVRSIQFRKEGERNLDSFTLVAALFDNDGNFVKGNQSTAILRLGDDSLKRIEQTGMYLRVNLDAPAGSYLMRVVVRESEDGRIAADNSSVEIPE